MGEEQKKSMVFTSCFHCIYGIMVDGLGFLGVISCDGSRERFLCAMCKDKRRTMINV